MNDMKYETEYLMRSVQDKFRSFKNFVLKVNRDENQNTRSINLFGKLIDFNKYYKIENSKKFDFITFDDLLTEEDLQAFLEIHKNKNKKRKNKLPEIIFSRIPWYKTIIIPEEWPDFVYIACSLALGFIIGLNFKGN